MQVAEVMTKEVLWLNPDNTLAEASDIMGEFQIRHLPVLDGYRIVGVISHRDILLHTSLSAHSPGIEEALVGEVMTLMPLTCSPTDDVGDIAATMVAHKFDCLPVVANNELIGIVTATDLLTALYHGEDDRYFEFEQVFVSGLSEPRRMPPLLARHRPTGRTMPYYA